MKPVKALVRAYNSFDPQKALFETLQNVEITHKIVHQLVTCVANPSHAVMEDLSSFHSLTECDPFVNLVHYIYFLTQHVHLFGILKGNRLNMSDHVQIFTFRFNNCPCPYIWLNLHERTLVPSIQRQTLPDYEVEKPFKITLETPTGISRYSFNLEKYTCEKTNRTGVITLFGGPKRFNCLMGKEAVVEDRITPIVLILTLDYIFTESILVQANGKKSIMPTWQHSN